MHTVKGNTFDWVRSSALPLPNDTASTIYPDRPIRPLPKRRIRSRLSLEEADTIQFPPLQPDSSPDFGSPNNRNENRFANTHYPSNAEVYQDDQEVDHICDCGGDHSGIDSEEEEEVHDRSAHRNSWPGRMMRHPREYVERPPARSKPSLPHSATSSIDGYESFENTNNKKKRKIPISGAAGGGFSSDGSSMNIPTHSVDVSITQDGYLGASQGPSPSGVGISGAGRGRNSRSAGRPLTERRPLASSSNGSNAMPRGPNSSGIISAAIANAAEGKSPVIGQENTSLLQRQHGSSVPKDFTFEWPSDSGNKMSLSGRGGTTPPLPQTSASHHANRGMATQGTQTSPARNGVPAQAMPPSNANAYPQHQQPMPPPQPRRRRNSLRLAAQERRRNQAYENRTNPPNPQDRYICEFCEYEAIFGRPPRALIRQYELKDQKRRKEAEAARRNLEKVKAKGRKNRKSKNGARNNTPAAADLPPQSQPYDPRYDNGGGDLDSQGEEYYDDGYDDPVPPVAPSQARQRPSQQYAPPPPPPPPDGLHEKEPYNTMRHSKSI